MLVKVLERDEKSKGGILIPNSAKLQWTRAVVVLSGGPIKDYETNVKEGDTVIMQDIERGVRLKVEHEGEEHLIIPLSSIAAIVEPMEATIYA